MQWASEQRIFVDDMALAQHYGVPTGYIDLTQCAEVALFFATCAYRNGQWQPVQEGRGILYRVQTSAVPDRIKPIGLQPFPRPSEQWAWTLETRLGEDFETFPYLQQIEFDHDESVGSEMLSRCSGGADLFPPDVMARVASSILATQQLPEAIARDIVADLAQDPQGLGTTDTERVLQSMVETLGIQLTATEAAFIGPQERIDLETSWNLRKDDFFRGVGLRLVRTRKMADNL